jgi:hypothetical protein
MRLPNFPTLRLAQLSMLIHGSEHLFSKIKDASSVLEVKKMVSVTANEYWHYHYVFEEITPCKEKKLGTQMINNILINKIIELPFAYGLHHNNESVRNMAIKWRQQTLPKKNEIATGFHNIGFTNKNAFDSQALIQSKNEYCDDKRCLQCSIGNVLLKTS